MSARFLYKLFAAVIAVTLQLAAIVPASAAGPAADGLPTFEKFVSVVANGQAGVVRGVYVPGVLALRVSQQPASNPGFVSSSKGTATQFRMAADYGVTGLLAHNYLSGQAFFNLKAGDEVRIVYGDKTVKTYAVSAIYQYQALDPNNPRSDFVDLNTGVNVSAASLFANMYSGRDQVTFQTCIAQGNISTWGRLFVVATPIQ